MDENGKVVYLAGSEGYTPLEQVLVVGDDAVLTPGNEVVEAPNNLQRLERLDVVSPTSDTVG